ncbi:flagellar hook-associated protein FlgK [Limnohabitans sp. B9-3]|uniref:flagellar hook-associated protein FlgK n=1 Tax=Limnohabitans sp. B9-3 TaxID=1100707 RepID=UPI000C1E69E3|nr:flagellar hook-associated protein FlgK [Limnohabitans sp. B9-3]PIT72033.1 flagellar hook-associated protein FlgK [Limnohabitans sp. B9-3]
MSDMLGISGNAIGAYQRALSTVSNNIANVNTEGYSRQDAVLKDSAPRKSAGMFFGTGVELQTVKRQFDAFAESNLRNSTSDLASQKPMVEYTKRVMDIMGDKSVGLSSALDDFFNAASSLSADPASTVLRTTFMRSSEGVASRFAELSGQLDLVSTETRQAVESTATQINTLTSQLALVNQAMAKAPSVELQPPELLDRRDLLLRQLSDLARVKTSFSTNGAVTVSMGTTLTQGLVVDGQKSRPVGLDPAVKDRVSLVIDPYGNSESLASASGGQLGGYQSFISQVLEPAQKNLNSLAQTFVKETNAVQQNGIDGYGKMGTDLFAIDPAAPHAAGGIRMALNDALRVATAAQFRVSESNTNVSATRATVKFSGATPATPLSNPALVNNPNATAGVTFKVEGARLFTPVTTLAAGVKASFYLDEADKGQQLQVMTRDGRQLLGKALSLDEKFQLMSPSNGFVPNASYSDAYLNKAGPDAYRSLNLFYGAKATVLYGQTFDANGVSANTTPMPAVLETARLPGDGTAIAAGALKLNGVKLGALNASATPTDVAALINLSSGLTNIRAEAYSEIRVSGSQLDFKQALKINGQVIPAGYSDIKSLTEAINLKFAGVTDLALKVNANISPAGELVLSNAAASPIEINSNLGTTQPGANALNLQASTYNGQVRMVQVVRDVSVPSTDVNFTKPLQINGTAIFGANSGITTLQGVVDKINDQKTFTGVRAEIDSNRNLKLITLDSAGTLNISVGPGKAADGTFQVNALGLEPLDYDVTARLKRKLASDPTQTDIRLSFGTYGVPPDEQTGDPSDLGKLGLRTGAFIEGGSPDDLLLFVTGTGTAKVATSFTGQPDVPRDSLRSQTLTIKFTAADRYSIIDSKTGTELASRQYDNSVLEPVVDFNGLQVKFDHAPSVGDSYQVDGNQDGLGNNVNMLDMVDLNKKPVVNGKTLANSYIDQINNVGNLAQQATITQQALTVVNDQAIASRDKISGVNLDDEAANLIRLQQAYQANAKALQISGQLFDAIVQIR